MIINLGESGDPPIHANSSFQSLSLAKKLENSPPNILDQAADNNNECTNDECRKHHLKSPYFDLSVVRRASSAAASRLEAHLHYKSGAIYDGLLKNSQKTDHGVFLWPNGDIYTGQFYLNLRDGHGIQIWSDGSSYEGYFEKDKRTGQGHLKLSNGEIYEGNWFFDYRHGYGRYKWNDSSIYEGTFFMNEREGYGVLKYSTGDQFIGLYKKDRRFGPGILKYFDTNEEDVGYWYGDKLIRLLTALNVNFEFADIEQTDKHVEISSWNDPDIMFINESDSQNIFLGRIVATAGKKSLRETNKNDPYIDKVLKERDNLHNQFFTSLESMLSESSRPRLVLASQSKIDYLPMGSKAVEVKNLTKLLKEIFKHFRKYDIFNQKVAKHLNIDLDGFNLFNRERFPSSPGALEASSLEFLYACYEPNLEKVQSIRNMVNVDVCDNRGYSGLILAVLQCDGKIINFLLDNGANVNHQLDNGLTALMISVIRYYTGDKFLPNIALKHRDLTLKRKIAPSSLVELSEQTQEETHEKSRRVPQKDFDVGLLIQSSKMAELESQNDLLRNDLNPNEELEYQYANLMGRNPKLDDYTFLQPDHTKLLLKSTQFRLQYRLFDIIELLLRRGADPSLSSVPYPALCFAVAAGDLKIVKLLLQKGADANKRMPKKYASLTPLCLACGVLDETGPHLVKLLLDSLADPNAFADPGDEYLGMCDPLCITNESLISEELHPHITGRTPLHIACMRNDQFATEIINMLLDHQANPNVICNGQSPLSLAIASGNKDAIDLLLRNHMCDPNLPLTNGNCSALCAISSTLYEHNWLPHERTRLIDKLIHYGADILQPIVYGTRNHVGSVVDYAYYMYNADTRLAHTPYHSLTVEEREIHNARKNLLNHLSKRFRERADEKARLAEKGLDLYPPNRKQWGLSMRLKKSEDLTDGDHIKSEKSIQKFCSSCGRSVGVKLTLCSRCKQVYYCSNSCKQKAWDEWHKEKCQLHESHRRSRSKQRLLQQRQQQQNGIQGFSTAKMARGGSASNASRLKQTIGTSGKSYGHQQQQKMSMISNKLSINPLYKEPENYSFN